MKTFLKIFLVIPGIPILILVILFFVEGGNGKKAPVILPVKNQDVPLLFAHRGVTDKFPENSGKAIEQAKQKGFKAVEIDLRKSADNEFLLFHDGDGKRLLGIEDTIAEMTLAQVKKHNLLFNGDSTGSKVITLKEMMNAYGDDFVFYFDMKLGGIADVDDLVQLIWRNEISKKVIVASPSVAVILYIEYQYPAINTAMEGFNAGNEWAWYLIPKNLKPDFLSGFASKVDEKNIEWLKKNDLLQSRIVYGVDSTNYEQMLGYGIKNMIIDYWPGLQVP
jgi:glycerophosphoryl diester phosphodiesterase